ncbi:MAG: hypothetical protein M3Y04_02865, partial [Actinomycetota bacterium]|nr:hypothetical protein [Actinomycetota bacterium]
MDSPLARPVNAFIDVVAPVLIELVAGLTPTPSDASSGGRKLREDEHLGDKLLEDIGLEALNLVAAFIDSDGRHTDDELWAFVHVFAGRFDTVARAASPDALRSAGLLTGRRAFLDAPSSLFDVLVRADVRSGTDHAWRYYLGAVDIAHAVFSLDDYPSHAELTSVERFRT